MPSELSINTTNLTKRLLFFHPSLNRLKLSWIKSFSTQTEFFCVPFHVPFIFWTRLPDFLPCVDKGRMHIPFSICYVIKVHFLSLFQTDLPKWLIFECLRLFTFNFIYENEFQFKSEFKRQAHICKFTASWTKINLETTCQFRKHFR